MEPCTLCLVGKILLTCGMMILFGLLIVHYIKLFKNMLAAIKGRHEDYPALVQKVINRSAILAVILAVISWVLNIVLSSGGG